jgi:AcrR family transcriptional regulator
VELNKFKSRGERTRGLVVDTALRLFREQGYDRTTMRKIAAEAGLSPGNAYYYFPSKQHLVQHFYAEIQTEHRHRAAAPLAGTGDLAARLAGALHAGVDAMTPYHAFAASFIKVAIEPGSPLSPFSPESAPARQQSIALFEEVVRGSTTTVDRQLGGALPELLWLAYLGLTLFWVHDRSPGQANTRALIDAGVPLLVRLLALSRLPVLRRTAHELVALLRSARP